MHTLAHHRGAQKNTTGQGAKNCGGFSWWKGGQTIILKNDILRETKVLTLT